MRKIVWIVLLASLTAVSQVCAQYSPQPKRKKVAVVLSGGGAKGVAHIGALKVIEEAGIPIDIITGTSMGSIVGGLYSIGYRADVLDSIVRAQDWNTLLLDRDGTINVHLVGDYVKRWSEFEFIPGVLRRCRLWQSISSISLS